MAAYASGETIEDSGRRKTGSPYGAASSIRQQRMPHATAPVIVLIAGTVSMKCFEIMRMIIMLTALMV